MDEEFQLSKIEGAQTMSEINSQFPGARRALFARYHIGGCSACAYQDDESLASVCERSSLELDEVIQHIINSHEENEKMLISPEKVHEMMEQGKNIKLVDTRTREEHEAVTISGSYFLTQDLQQEIFAQWSRSDEEMIILYDHTGKNVLDTCAWFVGHEMKNTRALTGGIDAWSLNVDKSISRYKLEV